MPQIQFLDTPSWGSALGDFGANFLDSYLERKREVKENDAVQNLMQDLVNEKGEIKQDYLNRIYGNKNISSAKKKEFAEIFGKQEERRGKAINENKKREDLENYRKNSLEIQRKKADSSSTFEKEVQRKMAQSYVTSMEELPKLESNADILNDLENLSNETTFLSGGAFDLGRQAEFTSKAGTAIAPVVKMYNPTGAIATNKLLWVSKKFEPKWWEPQTVQQGKIDNLRNLNQHLIQVQKQRMELIQKYNGNPPASVIMDYDREAEKYLDQITGWNDSVENPKARKEASEDMQKTLGKGAPEGTVLKDKSGKQYVYRGGKWYIL